MDIFYPLLIIFVQYGMKPLDKLSIFGIKSARLILNSTIHTPSKQLFRIIGWLSIKIRIQYQKCVPEYLCNLFISYMQSTRYFKKDLPILAMHLYLDQILIL
jgi:hypothetical protein